MIKEKIQEIAIILAGIIGFILFIPIFAIIMVILIPPFICSATCAVHDYFCLGKRQLTLVQLTKNYFDRGMM